MSERKRITPVALVLLTVGIVVGAIICYASETWQVSSLTEQVTNLTGQVSSLQTERNALQTQVDTLQAERDSLQTQVNALKSQNTALLVQIDKLEQQVSNYSTWVQELEGKIENLRWVKLQEFFGVPAIEETGKMTTTETFPILCNRILIDCFYMAPENASRYIGFAIKSQNGTDLKRIYIGDLYYTPFGWGDKIIVDNVPPGLYYLEVYTEEDVLFWGINIYGSNE
jgi:hypothetical protein